MGKNFVNLTISSVIKRNHIISLFLMLFLWLFFVVLTLLEVSFLFSDFQWSIFYCIIIAIIICLRKLNNVNLASLYSLFFLTSVLFIGGRFVAIAMGYNSKPLFELDFFVYRILDHIQASKLFYIVIIGFISLEIGYYLSALFIRRKVKIYRKENDIFLRNNYFLLYSLMTVLFLLLSQKLFFAFKAVLSGGYLALFQETQVSAFNSSFSGFLKILLLASSGIFLAQENKKIKSLFLFLMGLYFFVDMLLGGRGGFVCYLIFLLWYMHDYGFKQVNLVKLLTYILSILIFLSTIFGLVSLRSSENSNEGVYQRVLSLIYDQGVSLLVFNESMYIKDYPIIPFFQNFIPGFSFFYSKLISTLYPYDVSFSAFISYELNPQLYSMGYGLGWAFFADAYQYGGGNILFYSLFVILFSVFINYLQFNIFKNIYVKLITISLITSILFLPRSGLNTVFPLIPYVLILFLLIQYISNLLKK